MPSNRPTSSPSRLSISRTALVCCSTYREYSVWLASSAVSLFIIVRYIDSPPVGTAAGGGATFMETVVDVSDVVTTVVVAAMGLRFEMERELWELEE